MFRSLTEKLKASAVKPFVDDETAVKYLTYDSSVLKAMCLAGTYEIAVGKHNEASLIDYWGWLRKARDHPLYNDKNFLFDSKFLEESIETDIIRLATFLYYKYRDHLTEEQIVYLKMKWGFEDD